MLRAWSRFDQVRELQGQGKTTYFTGDVGVNHLLQLAVLGGRQLDQLLHIDIHLGSDSTNNTGGPDGETETETRADNVNLLAHLHKHGELLLPVQIDAVGVFVIKRLAGIGFTEQDVCSARGSHVDAVDGTPVHKRKGLGRATPGSGKTLDDNTTDASS